MRTYGTGGELADRLRHGVVAAVLTPRTPDGRLARHALDAYAADISPAVDGVCVCAHTGRGPLLSPPERAAVLRAFREATRSIVIAGVSVPVELHTRPFEEQVAAMVSSAQEAADEGADAVMVMPCPVLADPVLQHARTLALHEAVGERSGLPVVAFLLYVAGGGCDYNLPLLRDLASLPQVVGVKIATLDRAVQCQDAIDTVRTCDALAITGEDRMLGPSFMWGADAALLGISAALPHLSVDVARSWFAGETADFVSASCRLDRFAAATFCDPIDGYVQRMLWAAAWQGIIPESATFDPWSPALPDDERVRLLDCLDEAADPGEPLAYR